MEKWLKLNEYMNKMKAFKQLPSFYFLNDFFSVSLDKTFSQYEIETWLFISSDEVRNRREKY